MAIPDLPFEILHLIFGVLSDDLGSLYSIALSSRLHSRIALPILYANLSKFPSVVDDEDRLAEDPVSYTKRLTKWSSLWKTLALSSQNPTSTTISYAAALRVLDLQDLNHFVDELRTPRAQTAKTRFFAGGLEEYNKIRAVSSGMRQAQTLDVTTAVNCLADLISSSTKSVTKLIALSPGAGHLRLWLENMPALKEIKLFTGAPLADQRVRDALEKCFSLKVLEIYYWAHSQESQHDAQVASLLAAIPAPGLKRFVLQSSFESFGELSFSALGHHHGTTLTELEISDMSHHAFYALMMAKGLTNLQSCKLYIEDSGYGRIPTVDDDTVTALSQFFTLNTCLQHLSLRIPSTDRILRPAIPKLRLKSLNIDYGQDDIPRTTLGPILSTQSETLEELALVDTGGIEELLPTPAELLMAICTLHKLKYLSMIAPQLSLLNNSEVGEIAANCPNLEELRLASTALGDETLDHLATLTNLDTFHSRTITSFTVDGIRRLIESRPSLTAMYIYSLAEQFAPEEIVELKELLDSRGGAGLTLIEEDYLESEDGADWFEDSEFEP